MPGVAQRGGSHRRRSMNEINMVPFIDVMLVLLIIFMVSAPLITTGTVDLPSVGQAALKQDARDPVRIILEANDTLQVTDSGGNQRKVGMSDLLSSVQAAQKQNADTPVVIAADKGVKYESVVKVMGLLHAGGIRHVGLMLKSGG